MAGAPARTMEARLGQAIGARSCALLPRGDTAATAMARMPGTREPTPHRRLDERDTTWRSDC